MSVFYLDTSVVMRALLGHSPTAARWLFDASSDNSSTLFSSRILRTEMTRVLRREGLPVSTRDEVLDYIYLMPMSESVLAAAEVIGPVVKTLDAIHLGSVVVSGLDAIVVTHDAGMAAAAKELGYVVFDPVTD